MHPRKDNVCIVVILFVLLKFQPILEKYPRRCTKFKEEFNVPYLFVEAHFCITNFWSYFRHFLSKLNEILYMA